MSTTSSRTRFGIYEEMLKQVQHDEFLKLFVCGMFVALLLQSCGTVPRFTSSPRDASQKNKSVEKKTETKVKEKNETKNQNENEEHDVIKVQEGIASYYGDAFHGNTTANGETFDMYKFTAAHRTLPLGTKVRVKNLANNRSIILRINDRGPYVDGRIIDVSYAAAKQLGMIETGTANVRIEVLEVGNGK
ncbi:MAG: septal ring lytic transglycosylase RlpA family protein [Ignavibacteriales bacterium]|nr:septal ring lytic transglycosylase RlpA family protein [Ignavibacteriales bacterium]